MTHWSTLSAEASVLHANAVYRLLHDTPEALAPEAFLGLVADEIWDRQNGQGPRSWHTALLDPSEQTMKTRMGQLFANLLTNAAKYTPDGGHITVAVGRDGDHAVIRVTDTGVGIPADQLEKIFEPFVQVGRALHRPQEGAGLGLAISRDLARGMGGDLTVESAVGEGSTFTVTLLRA